jgi:hypothetical protein
VVERVVRGGSGHVQAGHGDLHRTVVVVGVLVVAAGAALGAVRFVGGSPAERGIEGALGGCALGAVIAAPGALALLARFRRPALLLPAGVLLVALSGISMAGATLPLVLPAVVFLIAYARRRPDPVARPPGLVAVSSAVVILLVFAAFLSLSVHQDPRSWSTPTEGGATSDVITVWEALLSLLLVGTALVLGWRSTAPLSGRAGRRPS